MALRGAFFCFLLVVSAVAASLALALTPAPVRAQGLLEALSGDPPPQQQPVTPRKLIRRLGPPLSLEDRARRKAAENVIVIMGSGRSTAYTQLAEDIANAMDAVGSNELRVIALVGKSAGHNIMDMLHTKGVDMAIVDQDILAYLKKTDPAQYGDIHKRVNYIAKLSETALHIYAKDGIKTLEDLKGKKISCLREHSSVALLCQNLFQLLKIEVEIVFDDAEAARAKVLSGEIAAAARGGNPPVPGFDKVRAEDGLRFVRIDDESLSKRGFGQVQAAYLPAWLRHQDYPAMIAEGQDVPTIATASLLAVNAAPPGSLRYQKMQQFVHLLFDNVAMLREAPRQARWGEVDLGAIVPGWTRFPPAQEWLDARRKAAPPAPARTAEENASLKTAFAAFLDDRAKTSGTAIPPEARDALYTEFVQWWDKTRKTRP